jgi:type IV pilus assembly protein PilP
MKGKLPLLLVMYICLTIISLGCGKGEKTVTKEAQKKQTPSKTPPTVKSQKGETKSAMEQVAYYYNPAGKIDPFRPLIVEEAKSSKGVGSKIGNLQPLQRFDPDQLRLVGIISDTKPPRALIEDVAGDGYIVTPGTLIGRNEGVVESIHENEIVIEEKQLDMQGKLVKKKISMKIRQPEEMEEK